MHAEQNEIENPARRLRVSGTGDRRSGDLLLYSTRNVVSSEVALGYLFEHPCHECRISSRALRLELFTFRFDEVEQKDQRVFIEAPIIRRMWRHRWQKCVVVREVRKRGYEVWKRKG